MRWLKNIGSPAAGLLSAPVYFVCVAAATALGFGAAMLLRPSLAYSVRETLGLQERTQAASGSFYTERVAPLLEAHCVGCHGERRQKGELRLDSIAAVMRGGKHGAVVQAGIADKSELFRRITLPPSNEKAMPPEGRSPLAKDELTVLKLWIAAGASGTLPVAAIKGAPAPVPRIEFPEIDEVAVARAREPLSDVVERLQVRFPNVISYESRGSADLEVNASLIGAAFTDKDLAALTVLCDHIVRADFSGTSITDASAPTFAQMKRLRVLRLADTRVTDATIDAVGALSSLRALTVMSTDISERALLKLQQKGAIRIYDGSASTE